MQEYVFVGSQGTFPVPPGESRIGSDAACQICIRGDGVLPIHAYLRMDGEKLLIRPFEGSGSAEARGEATVTVNGKPLTGPVVVGGGQEIGIAGEKMRVLVQMAKRPSLWRRRWFRSVVYTLSGIAALLLVAYLFLVFVVLEESAMKARVSKAVSRYLMREDTEIDSVQVKLFQGTIDLKNIRVKDRYNLSSTATPLVSIPSARIELDVWPYIRSGFREFSNLKIELDRPEVVIERSKTDGTFNIEDIIDKYRRVQSHLEVDKLDFTLAVNSGSVMLSDGYTNIGDTKLENIDLLVRGPGGGQPIAIEKCTMAVTATPKPLKPGALKLSGSVNLFDVNFKIDSSKVTSQDLQLDMQEFDLARIFEHFGYAWEPYAAEFKVVLGKPINGRVNLKLKSLQQVQAQGSVTSESLLSIKEKDRPALGNIPMWFDFDSLLLDDGKGYRPHDLNVTLRSGSQKNPYLTFRAIGKLNPGGTSNYTMSFECTLQDLLSTDVGKRLGLEGRMGGRLNGNATLIRNPEGQLKIDAKMGSSDSYVMVSDPNDADKPPDKRKPPVRQNLPLNFDCYANAEPNPGGGVSHINIQSFNLSAPSFQANSGVEGVIKGLGPNEKLNAHAQFILKLKGREFWAEFAPILALFGFKRPVEEMLDLKVTVVTNAEREGVVTLAAEGTSARQWGPDDAPVQLNSILDYDANAANSRANASSPYLTMVLHLASPKNKPIDVRIKATCGRSEQMETIVIEGFDKDTGRPLLVNSDIVTLRERFEPYIESWLKARDEAARTPPESGWLPFYRATRFSGELEQVGRITVQRMLNPKNPEPDKVDFELDIAGKNFNIDMPYEGFRAKKPDEGGDTAGRFSWQEPVPEIKLKGSYLQRFATSKEEPDRERLTIEKMKVNGRLGGFDLTLRDLDLFKLANLRALPNIAWTDLAAGLTMQGQVNPPACDFLRSLRVLAPDDPVSGSVALQIAYNREKDTLDLQKFVFKQEEQKNSFFLSNLDLNGSVVRVQELVKRVLPVNDPAPLSERLALFFEEGGPAALLDHLGDELSVNSLQVETPALVQWLTKDYKQGEDARTPPALIAGLIRREWLPEGTWKAAGVKLSPVGDRKRRSWKLLGALLRNDFTCYGPDKEGKPSPVFVFSHDWSLQLGLSLANDNSVALEGDVLLDNAFISAQVPQFRYEYKKPAKEPCKIEISDCGYSHGLLAQIGRLKVSGKPVSVEVKDFRADAGARGNIALGEAIIGGGPLPCVLMVNRFEPNADAMNIRISAPEVDIAYLASILNLPVNATLKGKLRDVTTSYKGSIIALQSMFEQDTAKLAARNKLEPTDARLNGLNPDSDMLDIDAKLDGVAASTTLGGALPVAMSLGGQIHLTTRDLAWNDLAADIALSLPGVDSSRHSFTIPKLNVSSADAKLNLARALREPGVPVDISASVTANTPLDSATLMAAQEGLLAALGAKPAANLPGERRFTALERLSVTGGLKTPSLTIGGMVFPKFEMQNISLKALKLSVPVATCELYGGKAAISDADYDLTKARTIQEDGKPSIKGITHTQKFSLLEADLALLLRTLVGKKGFPVAGRLTAQHGSIRGSDFSGGDRLSWDGATKFRLSGIAIQSPAAQAGSTDKLPPWAASFASFGDKALAPIARAAGSETMSLRELWQDESVELRTRTANALLLSVQIYLSKLLGVQADKLEFDAIEPTVVINKGFAVVEPFRLVGRGASEGLELQVKNLKVNLATEAFADDAGEGVIVYPLSVPSSTRARLHLEKWPAALQAEFTRSVTQGALPLRIYGQLSSPVVKYPWADLRSLARRALFDADKITDLESLERARAHFFRQWGRLPADIEAAAACADRTGAGLPGTMTARDMGESIIDRVPGLQQSLMKLLSKTGAVIAPKDSLQQLLYPEPDAPQPGTKDNKQSGK